MRHAVRIAIVAVAGLAAVYVLWPVEPEASAGMPPAAPPVRALGAPAQGAAPAVAVAVSPGAAEPVAPGFARRVGQVASSCGLAAEPVCDGPTCVVLLDMPDMESPLGWAEVLWRSPRFVLSTAARDLGLSEDLLPCAVAIDGLSGGATVVEAATGEELWCTGEGPEVEALCERRSGVEGFTAPDARRLSFRR